MKTRILLLALAVMLLMVVTACSPEPPYEPPRERRSDRAVEDESDEQTSEPSGNPEAGGSAGNSSGTFLPPRPQTGDSSSGTLLPPRPQTGNDSPGTTDPPLPTEPPTYDPSREIRFPDPNFEAVVREEIGKPRGAITQGDVADIRGFQVWNRGITDLTGIEYFTALIWLDANANNLTDIDLSRNSTLQILYLDNNQLTTLDVSRNTELTSLSVRSNRLSSLDLSNNAKLDTLFCQDNRITTLDLRGNPALDWLECSGNNMTSLILGRNPNLRTLGLSDNRVAALDVTGSPVLESLTCYNNSLTTLDVRNNTRLRWLDASGNSFRDRSSITGLDESRTILTFDTVTSLPGRVTFDGYLISSLMGRPVSEVTRVMGTPLSSMEDGSSIPVRLDYDGIHFWLEQGTVSWVELFDPGYLAIDGVALTTNRAGLISALGAPSNEGWHDWYHWYDEYPVYVMIYHLSSCSVRIYFHDYTLAPASVEIGRPR